jgi:hypothetical protein
LVRSDQRLTVGDLERLPEYYRQYMIGQVLHKLRGRVDSLAAGDTARYDVPVLTEPFSRDHFSGFTGDNRLPAFSARLLSGLFFLFGIANPPM